MIDVSQLMKEKVVPKMWVSFQGHAKRSEFGWPNTMFLLHAKTFFKEALENAAFSFLANFSWKCYPQNLFLILLVIFFSLNDVFLVDFHFFHCIYISILSKICILGLLWTNIFRWLFGWSGSRCLPPDPSIVRNKKDVIDCKWWGRTFRKFQINGQSKNMWFRE